MPQDPSGANQPGGTSTVEEPIKAQSVGEKRAGRWKKETSHRLKQGLIRPKMSMRKGMCNTFGENFEMTRSPLATFPVLVDRRSKANFLDEYLTPRQPNHCRFLFYLNFALIGQNESQEREMICRSPARTNFSTRCPMKLLYNINRFLYFAVMGHGILSFPSTVSPFFWQPPSWSINPERTAIRLRTTSLTISKLPSAHPVGDRASRIL